jgi:hypothetical protein
VSYSKYQGQQITKDSSNMDGLLEPEQQPLPSPPVIRHPKLGFPNISIPFTVSFPFLPQFIGNSLAIPTQSITHTHTLIQTSSLVVMHSIFLILFLLSATLPMTFMLSSFHPSLMSSTGCLFLRRRASHPNMASAGWVCQQGKSGIARERKKQMNVLSSSRWMANGWTRMDGWLKKGRFACHA